MDFRIIHHLASSYRSTGFALISPNNIEDTQYIYQNLYGDAIQRQIHGMVTGSNYPAINSSEVKALKIPFPRDLGERSKIGEIFAAFDEEIDVLRELSAEYTKQKKGLMQRLLTGQVRVQVDEE